MTLIPVGALGAEAQIQSIGGLSAAEQMTGPAAPASAGFGKALSNAIGQLNEVNHQADAAQKALATGQSDDVASVALAAQRAQLAMTMATSMRNKLVEGYTELLRTQM